MRVLWGFMALAVVCSACAAAPPPPVAVAVAPVPVTDFQTKVSAADPNCHDYTGQAMIDGQQQQVVGHACRQPDGSWKVAEGTPAQPNQFVGVYPVPIYADGSYPGYDPYFYDEPWLWDAPVGFGAGFVFFGPHFHHRFHGGFHRGFRGGFHHR